MAPGSRWSNTNPAIRIYGWPPDGLGRLWPPPAPPASGSSEVTASGDPQPAIRIYGWPPDGPRMAPGSPPGS